MPIICPIPMVNLTAIRNLIPCSEDQAIDSRTILARYGFGTKSQIAYYLNIFALDEGDDVKRRKVKIPGDDLTFKWVYWREPRESRKAESKNICIATAKDSTLDSR